MKTLVKTNEMEIKEVFKMLKSFKKLISLVLVLALSFVISLPAFAATSGKASSLTLNGEKYTITQSVNDQGQKVVTVVSENDRTVVVNTGTELQISTTSSSGTQQHTVPLAKEVKTVAPLNTDASGSISSMFWDFYCYWDDFDYSESGLYWSLECDNGSVDAYDENNSTERDYAQDFKNDIYSIHNNEVGEVAALGTAEAGLIAGLLTAETGIGAIAGIVVAAGGTLAVVPLYVQAWSSAQDANYNYTLFCDNL